MIFLDASKGYMVETEMHPRVAPGQETCAPSLGLGSGKFQKDSHGGYVLRMVGYAGHSSHVFMGQAGGQTTTE